MKRNKKYNPHKYGDKHIPFIERATSPIVRYINEFVTSLRSDVTVEDVVNHLLMAHRFTFMDGLEYTELRWLAENIFIKLDKLLIDNPELSQHHAIDITANDRELILSFLSELKIKLYNITSRELYARLFKDMIVSHNIYCHDKPYIKTWLNTDEIADSLTCCRKRVEMPNIIKAKKEGKIAYFNDGGDIDYMYVGVTNGC
jgi:hypothetical protein